jgi:AMMECR1 domain-containing protein
VTLRVRGELRGCIGQTTGSQPLVDVVKDAAVSSAFDDPRFPPVRPEEWPLVRIEISVHVQLIVDVRDVCFKSSLAEHQARCDLVDM